MSENEKVPQRGTFKISFQKELSLLFGLEFFFNLFNIDAFTTLLESGFIDTFRRFYPEEVKYTYWNVMFNSRARNVGWRIDYFLVTESIIGNVKDSMIYDHVLGSDHCPVGLKIDI